MRWAWLTVALGLLACGGKAVIDDGGGDGSSEPCPGFDRWCEYVMQCVGGTSCNESICSTSAGAQALQCLADLPSDATCYDMAVCGGA